MRELVVAAAWAGACAITRLARAEEAQPTQLQLRECGNRPPEFASQQISEAAGSLGEKALYVRVGRPVRIRLVARDPDGDPLSYTALSLPPGATFDAGQGLLSWQPATAQRTQVHFQVSDGRLADTLSLSITVHANAPPHAAGESVIMFVAGSPEPRYEGIEVALDSEGDPLSVRVEQAPRGARVFVLEHRVLLSFSPGADQEGEFPLVFTVSDGERDARVERTLLVISKWNHGEWSNSLLPGGGASAFVTHGTGQAFLGGAFDVTVRAMREDGATGYRCAKGELSAFCHASHRRFYAELEVLDALRAGVPSLFAYGLGFSSTLEWYPARRALIPFYSAEVGGLVHGESGHFAQTRAALGLHLWASDAVWVSSALGYRVVPANLYDFSGPTFTLRIMLNPW